MNKSKKDLTKYIADMREALKYPGAKGLYFPEGKGERKNGNLRFAREFGYGLRSFAPKDVNDIKGSLYGVMIVANSLDSTGVCIDAKDFINQLNLALQS